MLTTGSIVISSVVPTLAQQKRGLNRFKRLAKSNLTNIGLFPFCRASMPDHVGFLGCSRQNPKDRRTDRLAARSKSATKSPVVARDIPDTPDSRSALWDITQNPDPRHCPGTCGLPPSSHTGPGPYIRAYRLGESLHIAPGAIQGLTPRR